MFFELSWVRWEEQHRSHQAFAEARGQSGEPKVLKQAEAASLCPKWENLPAKTSKAQKNP